MRKKVNKAQLSFPTVWIVFMFHLWKAIPPRSRRAELTVCLAFLICINLFQFCLIHGCYLYLMWDKGICQHLTLGGLFSWKSQTLSLFRKDKLVIFYATNIRQIVFWFYFFHFTVSVRLSEALFMGKHQCSWFPIGDMRVRWDDVCLMKVLDRPINPIVLRLQTRCTTLSATNPENVQANFVFPFISTSVAQRQWPITVLIKTLVVMKT